MKICYPFTNPFFRQALTLVLLVGLTLGMLPASTTAASTQTDLIGPLGSVKFGKTVTVLPNGNIVVTDPGYSVGAKASVGAVYLYNGSSGVLISTLTGSTANDIVGSGANLGVANEITVLPNSSHVVSSPNWSGAGAATWCSGTLGCTGPVSASNSLVGGTANDQIGSNRVTALPNGNYVVSSSKWDNGMAEDVGAVTWWPVESAAQALGVAL